MTSNGTKLSFSFAPPPSTKPSSSSVTSSSSIAPKSNLELLMAKSKPKPTNGKSSLSFEDDEGDEDDSMMNALAGPSSKPSKTQGKVTAKAKAPVGQTNLLSRSERKAKEAAEAIDQSIFDYDEHYESMKMAERKHEESKKQEAEERKPKYIENFLASAQTRRLDKLRAEEKSLQREREKEGDEFIDKEKFVTEGYKKQMEEVRKAEEEEKIREEQLRKTRSGPGLTAFYKSMLEDSEAQHAAAVAATSAPTVGPSLAIRPPSVPTRKEQEDFVDEEEYDPLLAREAKAARENSGDTTTKEKAGTSRLDKDSGKEVEVNDNGEIVDKRSLLKAGLNITKKPKPSLPNSLLTGSRSNANGNQNDQDAIYKSRAVGASATYAERMERERKRLADQMREESEKKRTDEEERLKNEEEEAKRRRQGDNGDADRKRQEAKERYLARKRQREEEEKNPDKKAKEE
ncbi:uncharacterized protein IL334_000538 [Kwoniella shivajii]|uniref:Nuclear speckle splicing regulatory protein 1 N-terminal domain-containing protein n=1 Tax=Kwoniella shivajii TaxID=564305 RepID=A0ABZ1CPR1_9TREE|nr:hypothetical protein IL334_000538 [Kwoniella shivajii]